MESVLARVLFVQCLSEMYEGGHLECTCYELVATCKSTNIQNKFRDKDFY